MPENLRCPDCGHENPAGATSCEACNFPLDAKHLVPARTTAETPAPPPHDPPPSTTADDEAPPAVDLPILPRPRRPPRPPGPRGNQALSLWLLFGFTAAAATIIVALKSNVDRARTPVEGSNPSQQQMADQFREALAKDSTDVDARIGLANVLYDTGNWSEAIVHYRAAVARDSSRVSALVDLGVCYYNLSQADLAERYFGLALARDPHQPVALFNLGVVNERRGDYEEALKFFHRALESSPPEEMKQPILEKMHQLLEKTGKKPSPLPQGP